MYRVAIVINSRYGQTEKIAKWIKLRMTPFCDWVHVFKINTASDSMKIDLDRYDMVIIGAPVYMQGFSKDLINWTKTFSAALHGKICALYTVSGNAADGRLEARLADDILVQKFISQTSILPGFVACFGGAIRYTKYNFFLRMVMKNISKKAGGPTDTLRDHELTNWKQVDAFIHALLDQDDTSEFSYNRRFGSGRGVHAKAATEPPVASNRF